MNSLFHPSGAELKILSFKKDRTSLLMTVEDPENTRPAIFRVTDQGDPVGLGSNLRGVLFCRLCTSSALNYSDAFHHSSEFGCIILLEEYAVSCPLCQEKFTVCQEFQQHTSKILLSSSRTTTNLFVIQKQKN